MHNINRNISNRIENKFVFLEMLENEYMNIFKYVYIQMYEYAKLSICIVFSSQFNGLFRRL